MIERISDFFDWWITDGAPVVAACLFILATIAALVLILVLTSVP